MRLARMLSIAAVAFSIVACSSLSGDAPCTLDADCAAFEHASCTRPICQLGRCTDRPVKGTDECQCHEESDCASEKTACNAVSCEAHKCTKRIAPAGAAPTQIEGDCSIDMCDGTSDVPIKQYEPYDLGDASDLCVIKSCSASGELRQEAVTCDDGGVCLQGKCIACKPQNEASCGGEGPGEPANDSSSSPAFFPQNTPFCGFAGGSDIDWYTFHARDAAWTYDVFRFSVWSTAPKIELCIYVACGTGSPGGACASKVPGPNGSQGCCWTGEPASLKPTWDLDCSDTGDDSGTTYVSVRAPGADACEPYALVGGY